jgi:hypothetical protein
MCFMMYLLPNGDIGHMGDEMGQTFHSVGVDYFLGVGLTLRWLYLQPVSVNLRLFD